ncbi:MAG: DUF1573 domain-containing protein [Bacteroidia bacterium]|nr:DUF1573 domain-containing protein [Bacteroidia bacterium]
MNTFARFTLMIAVAVWSLAGHAQQTTPAIKFDNTTHDFGQIAKSSKAEHTFRFTNVSQQPVTLKGVRASCGCTTPAWTREAIAPGKTGEIQVSYNTAIVGQFTKSVTVTYDSAQSPILLYIKGQVQDAGAGDAQIFVHKQGDLAFDKISIDLGVLDSDKEASATVRVKNVGPHEISFTGRYDAEMMFEATPKDSKLLPGQQTTITVKALGPRFIATGPFAKTVSLYSTDEIQPQKSFTVNGTLNKVYSADELASMPNLVFESLEYNAGTVLEGEKVTHAFKFTNTGKQDLVLESVKASCGCTATEPKDKVIKPGASSEIVAVFDSRGREGQQDKSITVRSNDPDQSTVLLRLRVMVERDPFHVGGSGPAAAPGTGSF